MVDPHWLLRLCVLAERKNMSQEHLTAYDWDSKRWPNFSFDELKCSHSGKCRMDPDFLDRLQSLRTALGKPLTITSGYRDITHPVEAKKPRGGSHYHGRAVDIQCHGGFAFEVIRLVTAHGFTGLGISQSGDHASRFLHVDHMEDDGEQFFRPAVWSY